MHQLQKLFPSGDYLKITKTNVGNIFMTFGYRNISIVKQCRGCRVSENVHAGVIILVAEPMIYKISAVICQIIEITGVAD